jgi:hypothetical protein
VFPVRQVLSKDNSIAKLAIADLGSYEKVSGSFLDSLLMAFSKHPEIALLERGEIDKLLREQALSLSLSNAEMAKAGKLLAADAFLLLESSKSDGNPFVRLRLIDTRYGFKLWDASLLFPAKSEEYAVESGKIASLTIQKIKKFKAIPSNLTMLGVIGFRSEELSKRWDWLAEPLSTAIEQNLALYPSMILMERTRTGSLVEERTLAAGLPEALRPSAVFVDGAYRMQREKGLDVVSVYIRCRKQDRILLEKRVEGSVNNLRDLYQTIINEIMASLGKNPDSFSMNASIEAEMAATEAETYLSMKDPERALPLAEAALSLMPDSIKYKTLLVETAHQVIGQNLTKILTNYRDKTAPKEMIDCALMLELRILPLAEEIAIELPAVSDSNLHHRYAFLVIGHLRLLLDWCQTTSQRYPALDDQEKDMLQGIRRSFWHLYQFCVETYRDKDRPYFSIYSSILLAGSSAYIFCDNVEQAIELSRSIAKELSRDIVPAFGISGYINLINCLQSPGFAGWPKEKRSTIKIEEYLQELTQDPNSTIRLYAEQASFAFYLDHKSDFVKAKEHCDKFIVLLKQHSLTVKDRSAQEGASFVDFFIPIVNRKWSLNDNEDALIKLQYFMDLVEYAFQNGLPKQNNQHMNLSLTTSIRFIVAEWEKNNRIQDANALLQRALNEIHTMQEEEILAELQKHLKERYPNTLPAKENNNDLQVISILTNDGYPQSGPARLRRFRRLIVMDSLCAIVYSDAPYLPSVHFGVIRLSCDTFKPVSTKLLPYTIDFKTRLTNSMDEFERNGPAVAVHDGDLYLGFPQGGIAILKQNGQSKILNEENGLAADNIRAMDILDGKLYAKIGAIAEDSGLMEVDLDSGVSTILFSTKSKELKGEIDGKPIRAIAADAERHGLWILSAENAGRNLDLRTLYFYSPKEKSLRKINDDAIKIQDAEEFNSLRRMNKYLLMEGLQGVWALDTETEKVSLLLSTIFPLKTAQWYKYYSYENKPRQFVYINGGLIGSNSSSLIYFREGEKDPRLLEQYLPIKTAHKPAIREIVLTEKGLLVLTDDSLYLIPEFVEQTRSQTLPATTQK